MERDDVNHGLARPSEETNMEEEESVMRASPDLNKLLRSPIDLNKLTPMTRRREILKLIKSKRKLDGPDSDEGPITLANFKMMDLSPEEEMMRIRQGVAVERLSKGMRIRPLPFSELSSQHPSRSTTMHDESETNSHDTDPSTDCTDRRDSRTTALQALNARTTPVGASNIRTRLLDDSKLDGLFAPSHVNGVHTSGGICVANQALLDGTIVRGQPVIAANKTGHSHFGGGPIQARSFYHDKKEQESYELLGSRALVQETLAVPALHELHSAQRCNHHELREVPHDVLMELNEMHLYSQPCDLSGTSSMNPSPLGPGRYHVSVITALNWHASHRALGLPFDVTGVQVVTEPKWLVALQNRSTNDSFVPRFPLTQALQVTLLDTLLSLNRPNHDKPAHKVIQNKTVKNKAAKNKAAQNKVVQNNPIQRNPVQDDYIHIFVDVSNIVLGWIALLKSQNGLNPNDRIKQQPPFSFPNLHRILCRGRKPGPCYAIGSSSPNSPSQHLEEAESICGYHVKNMPRLFSDSSPSPSSPRKRKEHFVDETLQLRMGDSIMDSPPATMVVGTGDGNEAEYSKGFFTYIQRALKRGWRVELVAFRKSISSTYLEPSFRKDWGGQFKIFELDNYADLLFAMWASH